MAELSLSTKHRRVLARKVFSVITVCVTLSQNGDTVRIGTFESDVYVQIHVSRNVTCCGRECRNDPFFMISISNDGRIGE